MLIQSQSGRVTDIFCFLALWCEAADGVIVSHVLCSSGSFQTHLNRSWDLRVQLVRQVAQDTYTVFYTLETQRYTFGNNVVDYSN